MLRSILIFSHLTLLFESAVADCSFKLINYSNSPITAKFGFYAGKSLTQVIKPTTTLIQTIQSELQCTATTAYGTGRAFVVFPHDPNHAGANYLPSSNSLNLTGKFSNLNNGSEVRADDGARLWLNANSNAITDTEFEIRLNFTSRPNSFFAGTQ